MSKRQIVIVAVSLFMVAVGDRAWAQNALLVSGQTSLAIIDTDNDGPDSADCQFKAALSNIMTADPITADLFISSMQSNMPLLRACTLSFDATGAKGTDSSSNFVNVNITTAHGPMGFNVPDSLPLFAELFDETPNPNINDPVRVNDLRDLGQIRVDSGEAVFGGLCSLSGSPVVQIMGAGLNFIFDLVLFTDAMNQSYIKVPGLPFELDMGGFQLFDAYIPLTSAKHLTVSTTNDPDMLLVDINLLGLPVCGKAAPTFSGIGLIVATLGLLAMGTWRLSRRRNFARALSF